MKHRFHILDVITLFLYINLVPESPRYAVVVYDPLSNKGESSKIHPLVDVGDYDVSLYMKQGCYR